MVLASEAGVLDFPPEQVQEKGALRPGQMILVDLAGSRVLEGRRDQDPARPAPALPPLGGGEQDRHPRLLRRRRRRPRPRPAACCAARSSSATPARTSSSSSTPWPPTGNEPVGSMGTDTPLAVLSEQPQLLYWYFKQLFAQVTNPPIDSIREELVMSLMTFLGVAADILTEGPQHARLLKLHHPILTNEDLARIREPQHPGLRLPHPAHRLPGRRRRRRPGRGAGRALPAGRGGGGRRRAHAHPQRPRPARGHHGHPGPAGGVGGQPPPAERVAAHVGRPHRRDRRGPRGHAHRPAARLRRLGHQPVPGLRDRRRPGPAAAA